MANSAGSQIAFGSATSLRFSAGVATVSSGSNGAMRLCKVETASITVTEGGGYGSAALAVTVGLPVSFGLKVQHRNFDAAAPGDNQVKPGLQLVNTGSTTIALSTVTIRYWFSGDGGATTYSTWCDYAVITCDNLAHGVTVLGSPRSGNDAYLQVGFAGAAGNLGAGASTGDAQLRLNKSDWSVFNEANDWSYSSSTSYADTTKATAYLYGNLAWGTEP